MVTRAAEHLLTHAHPAAQRVAAGAEGRISLALESDDGTLALGGWNVNVNGTRDRSAARALLAQTMALMSALGPTACQYVDDGDTGADTKPLGKFGAALVMPRGEGGGNTGSDCELCFTPSPPPRRPSSLCARGVTVTRAATPPPTLIAPHRCRSAPMSIRSTADFDYHHAPSDTPDKLSPHALGQFAAGMALLAFVAADAPEGLQ